MKLRKIKKRIKKIVKKERLRLYIDISHCNLRCAMCPRGSISGLKNDGKGLMDFELFKGIIDKFVKEKVRVRDLEIGNWGEPLLNPDLPKMIKYAKDTLRPRVMDREGPIKIDTNLNYLKNPAELLESGIDHIGISVSGMTQEIYSKNHIGGKIEDVLNNIVTLANIRDKMGIKNLLLQMIFHDFIYNKKDAEMAERFCEMHKIEFTPHRMYIPSIEDNIAFHEKEEEFTKFYSQFIDLAAEKKLMKTIKNIKKCHLRRRVITINYDGQLYRCCGVFEQKYFMGPFFDHRIKDIPNIKSAICEKCTQTPISFR